MHLVSTLSGVSLAEAREQLTEAHDFLVDCCVASMSQMPKPSALWGVQMKRYPINLNRPNKPSIVHKDAEGFSEVVNMIATIERLLDALVWFAQQPDFKNLRVEACHPTTSSAKDSNDLVISRANGSRAAICEVCDVASSSANQNKKESKDIKSLDCANGVPPDGVRRFLCTSPEFAQALQKPSRKWHQRPYRYVQHLVNQADGTTLLELVNP